MFRFFMDLVNVDEFAKVVAKAPDIAYRHTKNAMGLASQSFIHFHRRARLRGRPGLNPGSRIGLNRATTTETIGSDLDSLQVGTFFNSSVSRYVHVQELGTVGKGGRLPDIVPVKAKFLRFVVDGKTIYAKKVSIPPRLKWLQSWDVFAPERDRILEAGLDRILEEVAE